MKAPTRSPLEAEHALDLIRELFAIEIEAADRNEYGTEKHRALRITKSRALVEEISGGSDAWKNGVCRTLTRNLSESTPRSRPEIHRILK